MKYVNTQLTEPVDEPVTLALVKKHLAVDHPDEDDLIQADITAARMYAEDFTGRVFGSRSYLLEMANWDDCCECGQPRIEFPIEPVTSIQGITYVDYAGVVQTLTNAYYRPWLNHGPPYLLLANTFPLPSLEINTPNPIQVTYTAGETTANIMLQKAIELIVEYWRLNPGGESSLPHLSRGIPAGATRLLNMLWTGKL